MHARRWQERQRQAAEGEGRTALTSVFLGLRNAVSGTAIPAGYPSRTELLAVGYACTEDLPDPDFDDLDDARAELERAGVTGEDLDTLLQHLAYTLTET